MHAALSFITSLSFLGSYSYAVYRSVTDLQLGTMACLVTSLTYHGIRVFGARAFIFNLIRYIDMIVCQFSILYFYYNYANYSLLYAIASSCMVYLFFVYYAFDLTNSKPYGEIWHASLHIVANIGVCFLAESVSYTERK